MSSVLKQISLAFGAAVFILVAVLGIVRDLPFAVIIYRGIIAMSLGTVVFMAFSFFFQRLLYRFVAEQILMQKSAGDLNKKSEKASGVRTVSLESGSANEKAEVN